eukprot:TRINITY_DN1223_c0_g1_i1.p1 TRINITY_DN1223_c0_g1~~TRINITY_DN1223_c0_g1_i1.p1  ORF type:complete len:972 (+),score=275.71 TRINITY_DN1223_c0_g1_i1:375-2918(+)
MQDMLGLAVLHPRQLAVYQVTKVSTAQASEQLEQNTYYTLEKRYAHTLEHTAYSFTHGPFSGQYDRDCLCVLSMDGILYFFERESFAFQRYLLDFMLPGPICYVPQTDSFVIFNSLLQVQSYKYNSLAAATADERKPASAPKDSTIVPTSITMQKHLQMEWSTNIGEQALSIFVGRFSKSLAASQVDIIVLGERHLFCLKESGGIRLQKRLDYHPSCACCYSLASEDDTVNQNLIVCEHSPALNVYRDMQLLWASKLPEVPVAVSVNTFGSMAGIITTLTDTGVLAINYLGTDPASSVANTPVNEKELNYVEMEQEMRHLDSLAKELTSTVRSEPPDRVILKIDDICPDAKNGVSGTGILRVSYTGTDTLQNIQITVTAPRPFALSQKLFVIELLSGGLPEPLSFLLTITNTAKCVPASSTLNVVAVYFTARGESRVSTIDVPLPLFLVCSVAQPSQPPTYKIHFDTNMPPPNLVSLFPDLASALPQGGGIDVQNSVTLQYFAGPEVTVICSAKSNRYRIQSDNFGAMWLIISELVTRLAAAQKAQLAAQGDPSVPFKITHSDKAIPLDDYFKLIDDHFRCRKHLSDSLVQLNNAATQFRVVEKRLLVRFRDKNAVPLGNMDLLLDRTYALLLATATTIEKQRQELNKAAMLLCAGTKLMHLILKSRFDLDDNNFSLLKSYLTAEIDDKEDQGWEETVESSLLQVLRTVMTNAKENPPPQPLVAPPNTDKLKNTLRLFCTRLADGYRLYKVSSSKSPTTSRVPSGSTKSTGKTTVAAVVHRSRRPPTAMLSPQTDTPTPRTQVLTRRPDAGGAPTAAALGGSSSGSGSHSRPSSRSGGSAGKEPPTS